MAMWVSIDNQTLYIGTGEREPHWSVRSLLCYALKVPLWILLCNIANRYPNRWQGFLSGLFPHTGEGPEEYLYYQRRIVSRSGSSGSPGFIQDEHTGAYAVAGIEGCRA